MLLINFLCIVAATFLLIGCSTMDLYYVTDARMIHFDEINKNAFYGDRSESVNLLLDGHYVAIGNNLVLLIRRFDKGNVFTIDDEIYEKLTIEIKDYTIGVPINFDSSNIHFYYSSGNSGFISKGHGVYANSGSGFLIINKAEKNKIIIELDIAIWAKPAGVFPFEGKKIQLRDLLSFKEKKVADLTPWLGVPAFSLGKEVYP